MPKINETLFTYELPSVLNSEAVHGNTASAAGHSCAEQCACAKGHIFCKVTVTLQYVVEIYIHAGWFKLNAPNCVTHEFRMQYLLECHIFGIILTAMNSGRGVHSHLFVQDLELTLL